MGKKLDALLGRGFKTAKFKATVNLAVSRLAVLKNQRGSRCAIARSDVAQLLNLGDHDRALIRVEQVMKEQSMLDVFVIIEGYCHLVIERVNLIEQEKDCPEELREAISSLIYAATRCGEFPELQELRAAFISRFGKEFVARATELRNNCGVNLKMIQKLSTKLPSLENKLKVLKEIASEHNIALQIEEEAASVTTKLQEKKDTEEKNDQREPDSSPKSEAFVSGGQMPVQHIDAKGVEIFSHKTETRKYKDVADAAQAAFESAAYAAAAARAAVELSRSESHDSDGQSSPAAKPKKASSTRQNLKSKFHIDEQKDSRKIKDMNVEVGFEKIHPRENYCSESEDQEIQYIDQVKKLKQNDDEAEFQRSASISSSDSPDFAFKETKISTYDEGHLKEPRTQINFDESDDDSEGKSGLLLSRTHDLGSDVKHTWRNIEVLGSNISYTAKDYILEGSSSKTNSSQLSSLLRSEGKTESWYENSKEHLAEESRKLSTEDLNVDRRPISVRTRPSFFRH